MNSLWENTVNLPEYEELNKNINVDVAIIGGGISGILTAYKLKKQGIKSVIFEKDRICQKTTAYTTGKISLAHSLIYEELISNFGIEKAREYAYLNKKAIEEYESIIKEENIECDFEKCNAYLYTKEDENKLIKEYNALLKCDIECEYINESLLPLKFKGAIKYKNQAKFNPFKFIKHILKDLTIYENTFIEEVKAKTKTLFTDSGYKIKANKIIFACSFPFFNVPGYYFLRMHQELSYFLILKNTKKLKDIYLNVDEKGYSFRGYDDILLFGGEKHRSGENKTGEKYQNLRDEIKKLYPEFEEIGHYESEDCITIDKVPYIGLFSKAFKDVYVITGFNKWGMTSSMVAANIISDMILKGFDYKDSIFSPERFDTKGIKKSILKEGPYSIKGIGKEFLNIPDTTLQSLPFGHGGIVEYKGKKAGVYKDEEGNCYIVPSKCPHLNCELTWNPDEKTWDCPCHGSRFDYLGNIIYSPSIYDLECIEKKVKKE